MRRDILVPALCLDHGDAARPDEQRIVSRAAFRRPFGDRQVASLCRSCTRRVAKCWRIDFPAPRAKLRVDQGPGRGLVDIDVRRSSFGLCDNGGGRLGRCLSGRCLDRLQFRRQRSFCLFRFTRELLPNRPLLRFLARAFLGAYPFASFGLCRRSAPSRLPSGSGRGPAADAPTLHEEPS